PLDDEPPPDLPNEADAGEEVPVETPVVSKKGRKKKRGAGSSNGSGAALPAVDDEDLEAAKASKQDCLRVEARAQDARNAHDWNSLLRYAKKRSCWKSQNERVKLLTKAY